MISGEKVAMQDMAGRTGLEPATSGVTGRRSNQLNYRPRREDRYDESAIGNQSNKSVHPML